MRMVSSSLRHHPLYCGDGRPSVPLRLVEYAPIETQQGWTVADHGEPD